MTRFSGRKLKDSHVKYMHLDRNKLPSSKHKPKNSQITKTNARRQISASSQTTPQLFYTSTPEQLLAQTSSSEFWGFPVQYSPRQNQLQQEKQAQLAEQRRQQLATIKKKKQQAQALQYLQAQQKQQDYQKYLYLACRYGPLEGMLYVCTKTPGKVYQILVNRAARQLQSWGIERIKAFRLHCIKALARTTSQQVTETAVENVLQHYEHERTVKLQLKRLFMKKQLDILHAWAEATQKLLAGKRMMKRAMNAQLIRRFQMWKTHVETIKSVREGKITQASIRLFQKTLCRCFDNWKMYSFKSVQIKKGLSEQMNRRKRELFVRWIEFTAQHKIEVEASIQIQRMLRGWYTRRWMISRQKSATCIQAGFRATKSRQRTRIWKTKVDAARQQYREEKHATDSQYYAELDVYICANMTAEAERAEKEYEYIENAKDKSRKQVESGMTKVLPNKYKTHLQTLVKEKKNQAREEGRYLTTQEATEEAKLEVHAIEQEKTLLHSRNKFRESNPPWFSCENCWMSFSREEYLAGHDCSESSQDAATRIQQYFEAEKESWKNEFDAIWTAPLLLPELASFLGDEVW